MAELFSRLQSATEMLTLSKRSRQDLGGVVATRHIGSELVNQLMSRVRTFLRERLSKPRLESMLTIEPGNYFGIIIKSEHHMWLAI